jgi:hypothetical protein
MSTGARRIGGVLLAAAAALPQFVHGADDLGRLFTTPQERAQLDEAREGAPVPVAAVQRAVPAQQAAAREQTGALALRGVVDRGAGRSTAWLNDTNTYQGDAGAGNRVERSGIDGARVLVTQSEGKPPVQMKVGQTFDPASGRLRDLGEERAPGAAAAPTAGTEGGEEEE